MSQFTIPWVCLFRFKNIKMDIKKEDVRKEALKEGIYGSPCNTVEFICFRDRTKN